MAQLDVSTQNDEIIIRAPQLAKFRQADKSECPACRNRMRRWTILMRWIFGQVPGTVIDPTWCRGGKQPSEPRDPISAVMTGQTERQFNCAGIEVPHLHYQCLRCRFQWLVAAASK